MILKYDLEIDKDTIEKNFKRLTNQIYKLLPCREEGANWQAPLSSIIVELCGFSRLHKESENLLFSLICKLEGLLTLKEEKDFSLYRKTIFECLSLINEVVKLCKDQTL